MNTALWKELSNELAEEATGGGYYPYYDYGTWKSAPTVLFAYTYQGLKIASFSSIVGYPDGTYKR